MELAFRSLTQNSPAKQSLVDYARKFRTICRLLNYDIQGQFFKFVEGLASSELKAALRRSKTEGMQFDQLVALAVSIENNLSFEKPSVARIFHGREAESAGSGMGGGVVARPQKEWEEGDDLNRDDVILAIMGVPITKYFKRSDQKGMKGRCFNCFGFHSAVKCKYPKCKFCMKNCKEVKHYSVLCPKAPQEFGNFLEARDKAKQNKNTGVRYTSTFTEYEFSDEELSDEE